MTRMDTLRGIPHTPYTLKVTSYMYMVISTIEHTTNINH